MSEATPAAAPAPAACPLPLSALPPNFQKHVDPKAPVPMGPKEMSTALFLLTFDADTAVRETAVKTAATLPDRILSVALRDETVEAPVLDYYADVLAGKDE